MRQTALFMFLRIVLWLLTALLPLKLHAWIDASAAFTVNYKKMPSGAFAPEPQLYWQVKPSSLHFVIKGGAAVSARMLTDIVFADDEGILHEDHFILETPPRSVDALSSLNILEQRQYLLDNQIQGKVKIFLVLTDLNDTASRYRYTDSFEVSFSKQLPFFGGIKLLAAPDSVTGTQLPLCSNFLDNNKRKLYYSADLYNIPNVEAARYPLSVHTYIGKKANEGFLPGFSRADTFQQHKVPSSYKATLPIGALTSGNYYITTSLLDKDGVSIASQNLFFQRMNTHPDKPVVTAPTTMNEVMKDTGIEKVTVINLDNTFLAKYTIPQLRAILKMLLPVSNGMQTNTINNFLKKPNEMYMKYFVYNYFKDINAADPEKAWKEYAEVVKEVNKKFNASGNAGYETDRGFIYLRYGKPTDIITISSESGSLPYEIWQYNVLTQFGNKKELSNMLFLFYKQSQNMTDYRLLHSTVPGEVNNYGWRNYLFVSNGASSAGFSMNSRAEELIGNR